MKRFVEYQMHEYMDMHPTMGLRVFEGEDIDILTKNAKEWCTYMDKNYSGGTTTFIKIWDAEEAKSYIEKEVSKDPDAINSKWYETIMKFYKECYE